MKRILIISALLFAWLSLFAQYPNNARKQRLGFQTTGAGLVYIQSGAPAHTPSTDENTWMVLDTTNNVLYYWDETAGAWENLLDDVVRDTVFQITSVPDTSLLVPLQGDAFINSTRDTMGLYSGTAWVLFYGGSGLTDGDKGDIDVTSSGAVWTIDTNAVTVAKIFDDVLSSVNFVVNDGGNIDLASEGDITVTPVQDSLKIFLDLADGAVDWDELSGPVQDSIQAAQDSIAMINSQLDTLPSASGTANRIARFSATRRLVDSYMQQTASSLAIDANIGLDLGIWTTASRPAGLSSRIGYNETNARPEAYITNAWHPFVMGASTLTNGKFTSNYIPIGNTDGTLREISELTYDNTYLTADRLRLNGSTGSSTLNVAGTGFISQNLSVGYSLFFKRADGLTAVAPSPSSSTYGAGVYAGGNAATTYYVSDVDLTNQVAGGEFYPSEISGHPALIANGTNGSVIPRVGSGSWGRVGGVGVSFAGGNRVATGLYGVGYTTQSGASSNAAYGIIGRAYSMTADSSFGELVGVWGWGQNFGVNTARDIIGVKATAAGTGVQSVYGVYAEASGGGTNYGVYSASGTNYFQGSSGFGTENPVRTVHIEGEARITDLTTDTPTRLVGADADGDLGEYAIAWGHLKKTSATSLTLGITDLRITGMTAGPAMNTTLTDSTITVGVAGTYEIKYSGSASLDPTTVGTYLVSFSMYNNSTELVETTSDYEVVVSASNNWFGSVGGHTIIDLADGDVISVRYNGTTGTPAELRNISISVRKL